MGQSSQALQEDDVADYHLSDVDMKFLDDGEDLGGSGGDDRLEVSRPVVPLFHVH